MSGTGKRGPVDELDGSYRKKIYPLGRSLVTGEGPESSPASSESDPISPKPNPASEFPTICANAKVAFIHPDYGFQVPILQIPSATDDLPAIAARLTAITTELATGRSVAIATSFLNRVKLSQLDPLGAALHNMSSLEKMMWDSFQAQPDTIRQKLPVIDWATSKLESPSDKSVKRFQRRAAALNTLYRTDTIDSANARWFTLNQELFLPLVKAIDRMQAAQRIATLSPEITYMQLVQVELDCLANIMAVSNALLLKRIVEFEEHGNVINHSSLSLKQRGSAMEELIRKDDEREAAGEVVVRNPLYVAELNTVMNILRFSKSAITRCGEEMLEDVESVRLPLLEIGGRFSQLVAE